MLSTQGGGRAKENEILPSRGLALKLWGAGSEEVLDVRYLLHARFLGLGASLSRPCYDKFRVLGVPTRQQ